MSRLAIIVVICLSACRLEAGPGNIDPDIDPDVDASIGADPDATQQASSSCVALDTFLCDGFESGDLSAWSLDISGGNLEIVSSPTFRGSFALRATTPVAGANARIDKSFAPVTTGSLYTRAYYYLPANLVTPGLIELTNSGDTGGKHFHLAADGSELILLVDDQPGADPNPMPRDTWFCVEMVIDIGVNGGGEMYIDGRLAAAVAADTELAGGYGSSSFGIFDTTPATGALEVFIDEIAMDTQPIGCL